MLLVIFGLFVLWIYKGVIETGIHADLARDLGALSDIWMHKIVWLGPMTSANFPASPLYYYLLAPGLFLSNGNGLSLIYSQAFFAAVTLGVFAFFASKKSLVSALLVVLVIGLSPWWITATSLPWNGNMYVTFVFLALTSLWFNKHFFISSLLFGSAIAIDLAAVLVLPVLFYEWIISLEKKKNLIYLILGLLLPWTPIIAFEAITKGFLTRQMIQNPAAAGISFLPNLTNVEFLVNIIHLPQALPTFIVALFMSFVIGTKKARFWLISLCLSLIFLFLVSPLRHYYLTGLVCVFTFIIFTTLSSKPIGKVLLIVFILVYIQIFFSTPLSFAGRSIQFMDRTIDTFISKGNFDQTKKYAVVSVRDKQNSTPQADDYRFFLRTKGINALNIDQYPEADLLLLFVEVPDFTWQNFDDWTMQRFGRREFLSAQRVNGIEIVTYRKE